MLPVSPVRGSLTHIAAAAREIFSSRLCFARFATEDTGERGLFDTDNFFMLAKIRRTIPVRRDRVEKTARVPESEHNYFET
jgi:hypothetical protein